MQLTRHESLRDRQHGPTVTHRVPCVESLSPTASQTRQNVVQIWSGCHLMQYNVLKAHDASRSRQAYGRMPCQGCLWEYECLGGYNWHRKRLDKPQVRRFHLSFRFTTPVTGRDRYTKAMPCPYQKVQNSRTYWVPQCSLCSRVITTPLTYWQQRDLY